MTAESEVSPAKGPSRKRIIISAVIGIIVMICLFSVLLPSFGSYGRAIEQLRQVPVIWLVALGIAGVLNIVLYPYTVLVSVHGLRYWPGFVERQVGFLISNAIPGGGVFAVGAQYRVLNHFKVPPAISASAVSADAVWTFLLTLGMPASAIVILVIEGRSTAGLLTFAVIGMAAFLVLLALSIIVIRSEAGARKVGLRLQKMAAPIFRRFHRAPPNIVDALVEFRFHAHDLVVTRWKPLTVANLVAQLTPYLVLVCCCGGLGIYPAHVNLAEMFAAYAVALLLVSFPITPGGLGTVDVALVALLTAFGAPSDLALAADLLWRLVWFLPQLIVGAVTMVIYLRSESAEKARILAFRNIPNTDEAT